MKKLVLLLLISYLYFGVSAQNSRDSIYRQQLQLVDSVKQFILNDLQLTLPKDFYSKWSKKPDEFYLYLYVSRANKVSRPSNVSFKYENEQQAKQECQRLAGDGYETLLYKTAGNAAAELNYKLLAYPNEAIAFIMFHEAMHLYIRGNEDYRGYPYAYEESLCDAVANLACCNFARKTHLFTVDAALKQQQVFESCYSLLNTWRPVVDSVNGQARQKIFKACTRQIKKLVKQRNAFEKDRMVYPVNNAYFLRSYDYACHYFELKQLLNDETIDKVIGWVMRRGKIPGPEHNQPQLQLPENPNSVW